uniref:Uncharacterized protein n=1 Tax=Steinernema glaseri TaxID=37863 RepID=A0A1I8AMY9_9BILA
MISKQRLCVLILCCLYIYFFAYAFILSPVFSGYQPPHHDLLLIDPHALRCLNCTDSSRIVHFASFGGYHGYRHGKFIHAAYNHRDPRFFVIDFNGETKTFRRFEEKEVMFNGLRVKVPSDPQAFIQEWTRQRLHMS